MMKRTFGRALDRAALRLSAYPVAWLLAGYILMMRPQVVDITFQEEVSE